MTEYRIDTPRDEANEIENGLRAHIFRGNNMPYHVGDTIFFRVVDREKTIKHVIDKRKYIITTISEPNSAPINKGFVCIGFRRIA